MDIRKSTAGFAFLIACTQANAVKLAPYDLQRELRSANELAEIRITKAVCKEDKQNACSDSIYSIDLVKRFRGKLASGAVIQAKSGLSIGSRYLFYQLERRLPGLPPTNVVVFIPLSRQPFFDGKRWKNRDWLYLPSALDAGSLGAMQISGNCFPDVERNTPVKICDVAEIIDYGRVISVIDPH